MKVRVMLCLLAAFAVAADVSGKWTAEVPGRQGQAQTTTFNFKVDGDKLSGTLTNPRGEQTIADGKVSGDDISFSVTLSMGGNEIKMLYKGKVAGSEIKFTREVEGRPATEFVAKRAVT